MNQTNRMPLRLVELVRSFERMSAEKRNGEAGEELLEMIHSIGYTAAFFGGFEAMKKLHDAAEAYVDNDNSVGYWLNQMWDGIGGWFA